MLRLEGPKPDGGGVLGAPSPPARGAVSSPSGVQGRVPGENLKFCAT